MLTEKLDGPLRTHGFARRKRTTRYVRKKGESSQSIDIAYDAAPRYAPEADAHVLPALRFFLPRVMEVALQMAGGDAALLGASDVTLFAPIDFVAPKSETPHWLPSGREGFLATGEGVRAFIEQWALPFLDEYDSTEAFVRGYENGDGRLLLTQSSYVIVAAAYLTLDRTAEATAVLEKHLGKPGLRMQFSWAFAFMERRRLEESTLRTPE